MCSPTVLLSNLLLATPNFKIKFRIDFTKTPITPKKLAHTVLIPVPVLEVSKIFDKDFPTGESMEGFKMLLKDGKPSKRNFLRFTFDHETSFEKELNPLMDNVLKWSDTL